MPLPFFPSRRRARLATLGVVAIVLGGVACTALSSATPSVDKPAAATNVKPAGVPAQPAGIAGGAPIAAPAPAVASDASAPQAQRAAAPANAASPANSLPDTSAQILDRMVIRTAQLTVEVAETDMESALSQARQIATRGGGFVSASNTHVEKVNDQDRMVADLTLQVRSDALDGTLSDLRGLGKVTAETSGSQDVTEEYVDLNSNLRNLQASESAILRLMDKATQIQDVLALQRELTNVRGQIERIQGRKTFLERRSDMATITLSLRLPTPATANRPTGAWDPIGTAARGWQASLALLRGAAEAVIVVAAFSWWLVPFVAVGGYIWLRRRRGANQATSAPPSGTSGPAPAAPVQV